MRTRTAYIRTGGSIGGRTRSGGGPKRRRRPWALVPVGGGGPRSSASFKGFGGGSSGGSFFAGSYNSSYSTTVVKNGGTGSTKSYFKSTQKFHPSMRKVKRIAPRQFNQTNTSTRVENTTFGQQAVGLLDQGTMADLNSIFLQIPTITGATAATSELYVHDITTEYTFTNMNEATCYMDLYEVTPRYMLPTSATPLTLFENGIIDEGVALGKEVLGVKPTMCRSFTTMMKINKKVRIELGQGQSHSHISKYQLGYKWNYEMVNVLGSSFYNPRTTRFLLIIVQGAPCNSAATKTNVTTATTAVDVVARSRYNWYYNTPNTTKYLFSNYLPTVTDGQTLDVGSGELDTIQSA